MLKVCLFILTGLCLFNIEAQGTEYNGYIRAYVHPKNYNREKEINPTILHILYTGGPLEDALETFANPDEEVSVHYLIAENGDIYSLVPELHAAWHAGKSHWEDVTSVNQHSIGIALVNTGITDEKAKTDGWNTHFPPFPKAQIDALIILALDIIQRKNIKPWNVVGHSDVAPQRKYDPGLQFPWKLLANEGIGLWSEEALDSPSSKGPISQEKFLTNLRLYGYGAPDLHSPDSIRRVVAAFQAHFRPFKVDGIIDAQTNAILNSLMKKKQSF